MTNELPVLVGIDGSRDGLVALTWAVAYAELHHAPLHVVHILDDRRQVDGTPPPTGVDDGSEVLDDALQELGRLGFHDVSLDVRHGHPAQVLLDLSERSRALVVGRRGMGGFAELMLGSTSQVCTALATKVPLFVVPDTWDPAAPPYKRIVVGIDGSREGQDALHFAFELARATGAEVLGVHAVEDRETRPDPSNWFDPARQPWIDTADELLTQTLDGWAAKYPGVPVQSRGVTDHPVLVLARESQHADLVVVGGVGRTAFSELRLGSVARGLLFHSRCPVAVVHHAES
ncbi:universal stress protein [Kribbella shirazensis]|uniref:Nucleotide-binding universal stress UspA family protein n=1 Tax=Kribbella shirazensis TaxID=1105143 RepID=A0A7X6A3C3_9ACTN|nr:universal stress protein [Kribbella shirazensis]NIK59194.1 nucleotide-binding universal stress UspA family protein [Kribbella shirazensis]